MLWDWLQTLLIPSEIVHLFNMKDIMNAMIMQIWGHSTAVDIRKSTNTRTLSLSLSDDNQNDNNKLFVSIKN